MNGFRSFVLRIARLAAPELAALKLAILVALALVGWGTEMSRAQTSDVEKASYADALAYCRGDVPRPIALRSDKRVLCLDGQIYAAVDFLPVHQLEQGGLFVVRGYGGGIAATIELADDLLAREATVIVNDYCLAICANYLFIGSVKTFVPRDALVAWINHPTGPNNCIQFFETDDRSAPRLQEMPCTFPKIDSSTTELIRIKKRFYEGRELSWMEEPPESIAVRRMLKHGFDVTGKYPDDIYWTWNPRYLARATRTKIVYEAYPQSQGEVNVIVKRLNLPNWVIYDP